MGEFGHIDLNSKKPYYLQVKELIQTNIELDDLKPGEKLPSEIELCRKLKVSRTVIRQALNELEQLGLIRKRKGKGSFVSDNKTFLAATLFLPDFLWENEFERSNTKIKITAKETLRATAEVAGVLNIKEGDLVLKIQRMYLHHDEPVILSQSLLPAHAFAQLSEEDMLWPTRYLNNIQGTARFDHADHYLEVTFADKAEAKLLKIANGLPLIKVTTYSFNKDNSPIAMDTTLMRSDRIRLRGTIFRHSGQNHLSSL